MGTYRRQPVTFVRGEGVYLYDDEGAKYLDFVGGIAVTAIGHAHPAVADALATQASKLVHVSNLYYTEPMAMLAQRLCDLLGWPDGKVFFCNSGAEANECAIKLVRRWGRDNFGPHRFVTIAALGSFHGRTLETLAATGQPKKWEPFMPLPPGFVHVPFDDADAIAAAIDENTCSVLLEPVQGEGGIVVPSAEYLPEVRKICDEREVAFIADEVQTGLGRTGQWFAWQSSGASPDVVTIAKALGNGLPIGACVARGPFADALGPGDHATTMGGGPAVCAAALAVLDVIETEDLVGNASRTGVYLRDGLDALCEQHGSISEVRGAGLLLALQMDSDVAGEAVNEARLRGLLVNDVSPSALRLSPALTVTREQCDHALAILDEVISGIERSAPKGER